MEEFGTLRRSVLPNGLRVVTVERGGTPLAAIKMFLKGGSRQDGAHPGIAHFLEHLLFSDPLGAATREFYYTIEECGGEANAVTTREYTALQAVVLAPHLDRVAHMFADLLEPRPLDAAVVERERKIILEEIALTSDSYHVIWDVFLEALWDGDPLARPVIGTRDSVSTLSGTDLSTHRANYMASDRIVIAAAGRIDHDALVQTVQEKFGALQPGPPQTEQPGGGTGAGRGFLAKDTHQTHLAVGVNAAAMSDPRRYAVRLLDIVLGRGARSRLHRALRTQRALVYNVSSVGMAYADRGYLAAYTACAPENVPAVVAVILDEFDKIRSEGVTAAELDAAKTAYEGSLARNFETVLSLASIIGIEELLHRIEPFAESIARTRDVTMEHLHQVAADIITLDGCAIATVGRASRGP